MPGRALYKVVAPDSVLLIMRMPDGMVDLSIIASVRMRQVLAKLSVFVGQRGTMLAL